MLSSPDQGEVFSSLSLVPFSCKAVWKSFSRRKVSVIFSPNIRLFHFNFFFLKKNFMGVSPACMPTNHSWCPQRSEHIKLSGTGVTDSWELLYGCWEVLWKHGSLLPAWTSWGKLHFLGIHCFNCLTVKENSLIPSRLDKIQGSERSQLG